MRCKTPEAKKKVPLVDVVFLWKKRLIDDEWVWFEFVEKWHNGDNTFVYRKRTAAQGG